MRSAALLCAISIASLFSSTYAAPISSDEMPEDSRQSYQGEVLMMKRGEATSLEDEVEDSNTDDLMGPDENDDITMYLEQSMGKRSMALGRMGFRPGKRSLALGRTAFRPGKRSMALGRMNFRPGKRSMALGRMGFRPGKRSLALGRHAFRPGKRSLALGRGNFRPGKRSVELVPEINFHEYGIEGFP